MISMPDLRAPLPPETRHTGLEAVLQPRRRESPGRAEEMSLAVATGKKDDSANLPTRGYMLFVREPRASYVAGIAESTVFQGDARDVLSRLPDSLFRCCVTSPPYWGLRDYKADGQT
jgi:hypothetical protein